VLEPRTEAARGQLARGIADEYPVRAKPGQVARIDYEYRRNGTVNIFAFIDAHRPWRHVKVTAQRTNHDFAECMRDLVDIHYPHADRIRVVLDNLSTHRAKNLYDTFPAAEARRILRRLEFHQCRKRHVRETWLRPQDRGGSGSRLADPTVL
jgi:hypothetical protein